jgi:hypothetical protein
MLRACSLVLAAFIVLAIPVSSPCFAASRAMHILDTNKDGTVDLIEANAAATALFDQLDRDKDGTLDLKELRGRLNLHELKIADPDNDGTLTKEEYLALVAKLFRAADHNGDGKLDEQELRAPAGRRLQKLLSR